MMSWETKEHFTLQSIFRSAQHSKNCPSTRAASPRSVGGGHLARALRTNNTLTTLNIGGNGLCDEGVKKLADALRYNRCLQSLNLSSCGMTDIGFKSLSDSLKQNNMLTELKLYNFQNQKYLNELSDDDQCMKYLTESLKENSTLLELVLPKEVEPYAMEVQNDVNVTRKTKTITVTGESALGKRAIDLQDSDLNHNRPCMTRSSYVKE